MQNKELVTYEKIASEENISIRATPDRCKRVLLPFKKKLKRKQEENEELRKLAVKNSKEQFKNIEKALSEDEEVYAEFKRKQEEYAELHNKVQELTKSTKGITQELDDRDRKIIKQMRALMEKHQPQRPWWKFWD